MIVADVNLLAYLTITGEHTKTTEALLRKDSVWAVPYLWRSEFRNVLAMHIQHRGMTVSDASLIWNHAAALVRRQEYSVDTQSILQLVAQHPLTAYDAEYVALAVHLKVPLVTFDKKLQAASPDIAVSGEQFEKRR